MKKEEKRIPDGIRNEMNSYKLLTYGYVQITDLIAFFKISQADTAIPFRLISIHSSDFNKST